MRMWSYVGGGMSVVRCGRGCGCGCVGVNVGLRRWGHERGGGVGVGVGVGAWVTLTLTAGRARGARRRARWVPVATTSGRGWGARPCPSAPRALPGASARPPGTRFVQGSSAPHAALPCCLSPVPFPQRGRSSQLRGHPVFFFFVFQSPPSLPLSLSLCINFSLWLWW